MGSDQRPRPRWQMNFYNLSVLACVQVAGKLTGCHICKLLHGWCRSAMPQLQGDVILIFQTDNFFRQHVHNKRWMKAGTCLDGTSE